MADTYFGQMILEGMGQPITGSVQDTLDLARGSEMLRNQLFSTLFNKVVTQILSNKPIDNRYKGFKKNLGPGYGLEESHFDLLDNKKFDPSAVPFQAKPAKLKSKYHTVNRKDTYEMKVSISEFEEAMASEETLMRFVMGQIALLQDSNASHEERMTEELIRRVILEGRVRKVYLPQATFNDAVAFATAIRAMQERFTHHQATFTEYGVITQSKKADTHFFAEAEILAKLDTEVLARAFNETRTDIKGAVYSITTFGNTDADGDSIVGLMVDSDWWRILDKSNRVSTQANAANDSFEYYLHVNQVYSVSPFRNAVVFCVANADTALINGTMLDAETLQFSENLRTSQVILRPRATSLNGVLSDISGLTVTSALFNPSSANTVVTPFVFNADRQWYEATVTVGADETSPSIMLEVTTDDGIVAPFKSAVVFQVSQSNRLR